MLHLLGQLGEPGREQPVVGLGDALQVGDHPQRVRRGVVADELAPAVRDEVVEQAVGEPLHELLVLPQPPGREQAHHQPAVGGVPGRVEGRAAGR